MKKKVEKKGTNKFSKMPYKHIAESKKEREEDDEFDSIFTSEINGYRMVCSSCSRKNVNHYLRGTSKETKYDKIENENSFCALGRGEKTCKKCKEKRRKKPTNTRKTKEMLLKEIEELKKQLKEKDEIIEKLKKKKKLIIVD